MGVDLTVYTVIGVRITDKEQIQYVREIVEEREDYFQGGECLITVIDDGMCGEYVVIGDVISSNSRYEEDNVALTSKEYIDSMIGDVPEIIRENFPLLKFGEISLISFNHYS